MLETISDYIQHIDDISFNLFYINFIIKMQDVDIENEFKRLSGSNSVNINNVSKLIQSTYEGLVNIW